MKSNIHVVRVGKLLLDGWLDRHTGHHTRGPACALQHAFWDENGSLRLNVPQIRAVKVMTDEDSEWYTGEE